MNGAGDQAEVKVFALVLRDKLFRLADDRQFRVLLFDTDAIADNGKMLRENRQQFQHRAVSLLADDRGAEVRLAEQRSICGDAPFGQQARSSFEASFGGLFAKYL